MKDQIIIIIDTIDTAITFYLQIRSSDPMWESDVIIN